MKPNEVPRRDCPFCEQPQWWQADPRWGLTGTCGAWVHEETNIISCDEWRSACFYSTQLWKELEFER